MSFEKMDGKEVLKVVIDTTIKTFDEPTFVKLDITYSKVQSIGILSTILAL